MMNMMRKSMERMINLVPSALVGAEEWAANDTGRDNGSSKEPARMDVAIDIELMPLILPIPHPKKSETGINKTAMNERSAFVEGGRGMVMIEMGSVPKAALKVANSSKENDYMAKPFKQASNKTISVAGLEKNTTDDKTGNISQVSQPSKASAEKGPSSNDGGDAVHPRDAPRVLASQLDPSRPKAENASWGTANAMAPAEGFSAACYGLFLRHGLLLLVLAVVCGISCLLGTLLPVVCDSRSSGQRSQYPAKKYWSPHRIFADPALVRMFRRKEATMA
ncbi:unnamed protein product [Ixodes pacificus]